MIEVLNARDTVRELTPAELDQVAGGLADLNINFHPSTQEFAFGIGIGNAIAPGTTAAGIGIALITNRRAFAAGLQTKA